MKLVYSRAGLAGVVLASAIVSAASSAAAADEAVANFYGSKVITVVVGSGMGGSYGLYGQMTAQHLGRHIPGNPKMVVQSMPGGGGMKALSYVYNAAPKDGSFIIGGHQEVLQETVLNPNIKFDVRKFQWLGRYMDVDYLGFASGQSGVKTLEDAKKRQVVSGATGARAANALASLAFNRFAGTKIKVVPGYKSTNEMFVAMERNEIEFITATWVVIKALHMPKIQSGQLVPIFAMSLKRVPDYPNVPAITEFGNNPAEKKFLNFWAAGGMVGRSVFAPPGVPVDRMDALRTAFDTMIKDPDFLKDAAKRKASLNPMGGKELEGKIAEVMKLTDDDIQSARKIYSELLKSASAK
jgi:tripartite-type tricarboxylate transporter receptor subunit TctC